MTTPGSFGYQGGQQQSDYPPPGPIDPMQHKFTPDELRVLGECNRESFLQRSLPIGTMLGLGTFAAVQNGHLRPNPRFGAFPKVSLAVVVGYFLGKLSYQQACADKLMALPGSYIGQLLREKRDGKVGGTSIVKQPTSMFGAGPSDIYSDAGPGSSLDLDTDRPLFSDESYRADNETATGQNDAQTSRAGLSYEDLRRKNRGNYSDTKQDPYRIDPNSLPPISRGRPIQPPSASTNQYGDLMD